MVIQLLLLVLSCRKRLDEQPLRRNFVASVVEVLEQEQEQEQEFEPVAAAAVAVAATAAVVPVQE